MIVNQFLFNLIERHLFAVEHAAPSLVDFHRADVLTERPVRLTAVRQSSDNPCSSSGVVIMKMISSTNIKSINGVTLRSLSVTSELRCEKRRMTNYSLPEAI